MNTLAKVGVSIDLLLNIKNDEYPVVKILERLRLEHFNEHYNNNVLSLVNATVSDVQLFLNKKLDIKIESNKDNSLADKSSQAAPLASIVRSFHHQRKARKSKSKDDSTIELEAKHQKVSSPTKS